MSDQESEIIECKGSEKESTSAVDSISIQSELPSNDLAKEAVISVQKCEPLETENTPKDSTTDILVPENPEKVNETTTKIPAENKVKGPDDTASTEERSTKDGDAYAEHVTYTDDGNAIYTDPQTNHKYKWDAEQNNWLACDDKTSAATSSASASASASSSTNASATAAASDANPYENEHYKWCTKTQKWLLKTSATETEHYKWDAEKKEWVPKASVQKAADRKDVTYAIDADGQRIYTDKDGAVFFWDADKSAWFPKIDDDFMARYQMSYGFIDNTSASEEAARVKVEQERQHKELELERMTEEARASAAASADDAASGKTSMGAGTKRKAAQEPPKWFEMDPAQNTKVYVSNLPLDITFDEFVELMGKCGMIMRDQQTQKFKLKLYAEPDGQLKGDGLCDYIKVESVDLALNILDGYYLRGHKLHVQRAKFQMRGEYNPALKPKRKKKDKEKLQKMKEKLFDWRPEKMRGERSKNEKIVIIKNLFIPETFEKEVELILEYQNDLREECGKCGVVRKVVIYDRHSEGIAQVNMASPEEADVVIQMMQGRYFGKRQLSAEHWDGKTKYKVAESETEVQKRLNNWDQFLETEDDKHTQANTISVEDKAPSDPDDTEDDAGKAATSFENVKAQDAKDSTEVDQIH